MKCVSVIVYIFFVVCSLATFTRCWRQDSLLEPVSRKSKLFTLNASSAEDESENFAKIRNENPPFITRPKCIDGTAECLHAKAAQFNSFGSRFTENRENITRSPAAGPQNLKMEKLTNLYPTKPIGKPAQLPAKQISQKKLKVGTSTGGTNNTEGRIIAYKLNQTSVIPMQAVGSAAPRPTITLGQLARQVLFPSWLWTRFATNRRIDADGTKSNSTRSPYLKTAAAASAPSSLTANAQISLPSITFDNNISRFMKLFTLVRFQNTPCVSSSGRNGTCYHSRECTTLGGTASDSCASGFGVCCVFQNSCGQTTSTNGTYFVDNDMVFNSNNLNTCSLHIMKMSPAVKQMRLDFQIFSIQPPNAGNCELDRFIISGQNTNDIVPILCGDNNGTHLYVETEGSSTGIQLSVLTTGVGKRKWSIRVTQFEAASYSSAPTNCLQYYTGVMGSIASFNYLSSSSPQYLNNLNYVICLRKEPGFCSVTFTNSAPDGTYMPFQVVNANDNGQLVIPGGQAGIGIRDCPYDFLAINGYRLCGERFNDATTNVRLIEDAPVSDMSNGPFIVTVRTNDLDVGGGFFLYYRQNPCMSTSG